MERRLAAILAADVVGYSRLMGEDETGTLGRLRLLRSELVQPTITERKGRIVKLMGDGLLAEFPSVVEAVQCAVDIQQSMTGREADLPGERRLRLRIGVNLGDVIVEGSDIYGDGVNVAARLEGLAEPGGVCISGKVREEVRNKLSAAFEDLGEQKVKNIAEPVRVYRWNHAGVDRAPGMMSVDETLPLPDKPSIAVYHRGHHHRALAVPQPIRHRPQLVVPLQGPLAEGPGHWPRARRPVRRRGQRAQGRQPGAHHRSGS
jgi:adenylate cyclase